LIDKIHVITSTGIISVLHNLVKLQIAWIGCWQ